MGVHVEGLPTGVSGSYQPVSQKNRLRNLAQDGKNLSAADCFDH